jgi:predicted molibdopterin-dependent oxidoreductase YjgC
MALDLVAERLSEIGSDQGGGERIFGLASDGCSNEEIMLFMDLMRQGFGAASVETLGGNHLRTIAQAWSELRKRFLGLKEGSWKRLPESDYILFAGVGQQERQTLLFALARRSVVENGAKIGVMGPVDVMHPWTSDYLAWTNGNASRLATALLAEVMAEAKRITPAALWEKISRDVGELQVSELLAAAGVEGEALKAFGEMVGSFSRSKAPMVVVGDGAIALKDPQVLKRFMHLALLKNLLPENALRLLILKPGANSAGAIKLKLLPPSDPNAATRWRGGIILLDDQEKADCGVLERLQDLEFLAVLTPYFPENLAKSAHVLLPKPSWLEQDGTYASLDGHELARTTRVLDPPLGVQDSWQTMAALATRTNLRVDFDSLKELSDRAARRMNLLG